MSVEIPTSNGKPVIVDDEYAFLDAHTWNWRTGSSPDLKYARSMINNKHTYIHRYIYTLAHGPIGKGLCIHHINHDPADNRLANLKAISYGENTHLSRAHEKGLTTSQYQGVSWKKPNSKWQAAVKVNGKSIYLGLFENELDAAQAAANMRDTCFLKLRPLEE